MNAYYVEETARLSDDTDDERSRQAVGKRMREGYTEVDPATMAYYTELAHDRALVAKIGQVTNSLFTGATLTKSGRPGAETSDPAVELVWSREMRKLTRALLTHGLAAITLVPGRDGRLEPSVMPNEKLEFRYRLRHTGEVDWWVFPRPGPGETQSGFRPAPRSFDGYANGEGSDLGGIDLMAQLASGGGHGGCDNRTHEEQLASLRGDTIADRVMNLRRPLAGGNPSADFPLRQAHVVVLQMPENGQPRSAVGASAASVEAIRQLVASMVDNVRLAGQPPVILEREERKDSDDTGRIVSGPSAGAVRGALGAASSTGSQDPGASDQMRRVVMYQSLLQAERGLGGNHYQRTAMGQGGDHASTIPLQVDDASAARGRVTQVRLSDGERVSPGFTLPPGRDVAPLLSYLESTLAAVFSVPNALAGRAGEGSRLNSGTNTSEIRATEDARRAMRAVLDSTAQQLMRVVDRTNVVQAATDMVLCGHEMAATAATAREVRRRAGPKTRVQMPQQADVGLLMQLYHDGFVKYSAMQQVMGMVTGLSPEQFNATAKPPLPPAPGAGGGGPSGPSKTSPADALPSSVSG